jgi:hypothetical protein
VLREWGLDKQKMREIKQRMSEMYANLNNQLNVQATDERSSNIPSQKVKREKRMR